MSPTKVAIIGANGNLGPSVLTALLHSTSPAFTVTVLSRESSTSTYPSPVTVRTIPDSLEHSALVSALSGQHALVITVSGTLTAPSLKFITAAAEAGVQRIIPADFGSCDSSDPRSLALIPLYPAKKDVRDHLEKLSRETEGKVTWTSIICGHYLDFGLRSSLMQVWAREGRARHFDGGDVRFSASVLRTVGAAVVGVLTHLEETRNQLVYVQSVSTTQNELLKVVESVVGRGAFEVEHRDSDQFISEQQAVLRERPDDHETTENLVSVEGIVNGDWMGRKNFMNGLFGLPDEDLELLVRESLEGWL